MANSRVSIIVDKVDIWLKLEGLPSYSELSDPIKDNKADLLAHEKEHRAAPNAPGWFRKPADECLACALARLVDQLP